MMHKSSRAHTRPSFWDPMRTCKDSPASGDFQWGASSTVMTPPGGSTPGVTTCAKDHASARTRGSWQGSWSCEGKTQAEGMQALGPRDVGVEGWACRLLTCAGYSPLPRGPAHLRPADAAQGMDLGRTEALDGDGGPGRLEAPVVKEQPGRLMVLGKGFGTPSPLSSQYVMLEDKEEEEFCTWGKRHQGSCRR